MQKRTEKILRYSISTSTPKEFLQMLSEESDEQNSETVSDSDSYSSNTYIENESESENKEEIDYEHYHKTSNNTLIVNNSLENIIKEEMMLSQCLEERTQSNPTLKSVGESQFCWFTWAPCGNADCSDDQLIRRSASPQNKSLSTTGLLSTAQILERMLKLQVKKEFISQKMEYEHFQKRRDLEKKKLIHSLDRLKKKKHKKLKKKTQSERNLFQFNVL